MASRDFGFDTTTDQVLEGQDLTGRLVLVTGGASGLGQETVRALAAKGAKVVIAARNMDKAADAVEAITTHNPQADIEIMELDLAELDSVRAFTILFQREHPQLDVLINNAGVMACAEGKTADGFEMQFGTNHLGHFLLTNRLKPALEASAKAGRKPRVVTLSSRAHQRAGVNLDDLNWQARDYDKWVAYGESKSANALFALELDNRWKVDGIRSFSVHPGGIMTPLARHLTEEDMTMLRARFDREGAVPQLKSVEQGAATSVYAATAPELDGEGGFYLENAGRAKPNDDLETDVPEQVGAGVRSWAQDPEIAARLWTASEAMVGESFA